MFLIPSPSIQALPFRNCPLKGASLSGLRKLQPLKKKHTDAAENQEGLKVFKQEKTAWLIQINILLELADIGSMPKLSTSQTDFVCYTENHITEGVYTDLTDYSMPC